MSINKNISNICTTFLIFLKLFNNQNGNEMARTNLSYTQSIY